MEDIQTYLFTFEPSTPIDNFQKEIAYYNLTDQKTYSIVYDFIDHQLQKMLQLMASNSNFDYQQLISLSNVLLFINKNYLKKLETIVLSKCENIFDTCLEILELISKTDQVDYSKSDLVHLIIVIIQEVMKPYPNDLYLHTNNQRYLNILVISLSTYCEVRNFIMFLIQSNKNRDIYNYMIKNIANFFEGIKRLMLNMSFADITKEVVSIAIQFKINFKDIVNEFQSFINFILTNTKDKRTEKDLKILFSSLFNIIQDEKIICYGIGNMLLHLYEDNINSPDICQPIISTFFTEISGEYYVRLLQNTDLIRKFISKLYNQRNQETIAFFFYFLNSLSFSYETSKNEVYIPKIEFKTIIESIQYFNNNELILKFIFERLMSLFDQKTTLGTYFLEECDYFQQMKTIVSMNNNISMLTLEFTEELFKKNLSEKIWDKASRSNVFYFDTIQNLDPLMQKIIWINLTYEQRPEKFYEKAQKIIDHINVSSIVSQQIKNEDNCSIFIILLRILLKSISQRNNNVIYKVKYSLFTDIEVIIQHFLMIIANKPPLWNNFIIVFDLIFGFIFQFNRSMANYKFYENKNEDEPMMKSPVLFSSKIIKQYLKEVLVNISKDGSQNLLCYLFKKCIQYTNNEDRELFISNTLNPIDYCLKAFQIPSMQSASKYSTIMINSHLIIKCLLSAVFNTNSLDNKIHLLTYLDLLCRINEQNNTILLRGKIIKKLVRYCNNNKEIDDIILSLLRKLSLYFNKEDLIEYLKFIYVLLINEHNVNLAKQLLKIIELNMELSLPNMHSVTLSSLNSNNSGTYYMLFLDSQQTKVNTVYVYYKLYIPSMESLYYFTLGQFVTYDNTIHIYFDKEYLQMTYNNKKTSFNIFNEKITAFNKWHSVLIQPGNEFAATIKHSIIRITYPKHYLFEQNSNNQQFDFAAGYVYLKEITKRNDQLQFDYSENSPYINISYLVITTEEITERAITKNASQAHSRPKLSKLSSKAIIAEVFFDQFSLVNVQSLANLMYKMSDPYDLDPTKTELIAKIECNDGLKGYNDLYLFKNCNILDYASMNDVFQLDTLNKSYLSHLLFRFNSFLHISFNDLFVADLLMILMQNMERHVFLLLYESIFRVIFVINNEFQLMFFHRHMLDIKILFANYAEDFQIDFVSIFIYNKYVDINEKLQYLIISEIFFYPHLYIRLKYEVQKKINTEFEKFLNYYENNDEVDYSKMKNILVNLWSLFIHYEIDTVIPQGEESRLNSLSGSIELLNSIILLGSHNELPYLSNLAFLLKNTFIEYDVLKVKCKKNQITNLPFLLSETIERQISLMKKLLNDFAVCNNCNQQRGVLTYLSHHFILEFEVFKNKIRYERIKRSLNRHIQLLFPELLNKDRYSWYLDKKEGNCRMRRRMLIKENSSKDENNKELKVINNMFKQLSLFDTYADLSMVKCMIDEEDKFQNCFICLLIERIYETESLIVLGENSMYLYTNIICDKNKKIYLFSIESTRAFWARNDIDDEWEKLAGRGKDKNNEPEDKNILINHKSLRIKIKTISYKEISELHKRRYMHQNNSFEIFLLNGSSYFITVFPKVRDELFSRILNNINDKSIQSKISNINKSGSQTIVYLKHYPIIFQRSKLNKKAEISQVKTVIEIKNIIMDISEKWSQCFISNFNYLMILNTLGGRTYNDMSQYFIFPWILKDFFSPNFCLKDEAYFRDLTYPTHAQTQALRVNLKAKISNSLINNHSETCHSGIFLSNLTQISYYLLRLKPFTEVSLDIHGGNFDSTDRLFTSMKIFCEMKNISQEWIPELIYLSELLININNYSFGKEKEYNADITYNDVALPPWAKNDPKFFSQIMMKAVESPRVSENLHNWIDLLFGYKMPFGKINFEYFNRYLSLCYFFEDLRGRKYDKTKLNEMLFQTKEFGSNPLQIIFKNHIQKKESNLYSFLPFFGTNARIENCVLKPFKSICKIRSKRIGDMRGLYELPKQNITNGEGGLTSLSSYIDQSLDEFNDDEGRITRKYFVVGENKSLLGQSFTSVLSYSSTAIYISKPLYNTSYEFDINDQARICSVTSSINSKYIVIGLSSGAIIKFRKRANRSEEIFIPSSLETKIIKTKQTDQFNNIKVLNPTILFFENINEQFIDFTEIDNNSPSKFSKKQLPVFSLNETHRSNISTSPIVRLCLCESYSFLLAIDNQRNIYLYDFNELKLRYKFNFNKISNVNYCIKHVKVINNNCDFLIATKYSLHLYSINGIPILDVDLHETHQFFGRSPITSIEAVSLFDTLIFTGHADGSIYISKLITEIPYEFPNGINKQERPLYESFHRRYNMSYVKKYLNNKQLQKRRLNLIKKISISQKKIIYLKISDDMIHLYIINKKKEVFCYNCDEYLKENLIKGKKCSIHKSVIKVQCKYCKKLICEVCLENDSNSSVGLCEECNLSNTSSEKLTHDY